MNRAHLAKLSLSAVALTTLLAPSHALATTAIDAFDVPGTACQPSTPADANCVEYTQYGVHNTCATAITVECPIQRVRINTKTSRIYSAYVYAYDRSTAADVSCSLEQTDRYGNVTYQSTRNTSGNSVDEQLLFYAPSTSTYDLWWRFRCSVPGVETPGWFSHLTNISVLSVTIIS